MQQGDAFHHIFKFRILIFEKEKEDPKNCHEVEARLLVHQGVGWTELVEHCSVFFVDAVAELHAVGLCPQPQRGFPPLCGLPSQHFQQLFLRESARVPHHVLDGDSGACPAGVTDVVEDDGFAHDGRRCQNLVLRSWPRHCPHVGLQEAQCAFEGGVVGPNARAADDVCHLVRLHAHSNLNTINKPNSEPHFSQQLSFKGEEIS
jgi:hypothetical protein